MSSASTREVQQKIETLRNVLATDLIACDAKWTLFVAAALSYRYDSKLKPIPPQFEKQNQDQSIDDLLAAINDTPKLRIVLEKIEDQNYQELGMEVIELLYWVLITMRDPALRLVEEEEEYFPILCAINELSIKEESPTHVFEVKSLTGFHSDVAFRNQVSNLPVQLAFMGNKLDSLYSILYNGFSTETKHIELTTDLHYSLKCSPNVPAWGASQCGSIIKCIAICEYAFDPSDDRILTQDDNSYIQLKNPQNIRLRYLLFYGSRLSKKVLPQRGLFSWIYRHKYPITLISYTLLLISIGVANSASNSPLKLYIRTKFESFFDLCEGMLRSLQR